MENWYLACSRRGKLNLAKALMSLEAMNVTAFVPKVYRIVSRTDRPGQTREIVESLFLNYFFVLFDPNSCHTSKIESAAGLSSLVRFGGEIKAINRSIVEEIMRLPVCRNEVKKSENINYDTEITKKIDEIAKMDSAAKRFSHFYNLVKDKKFIG